VRFWFDDALRLRAAKALQQARLTRITGHWIDNRALSEAGFDLPHERLETALAASRCTMLAAPDNTALLTEEARLTKTLFRLACDATGYGDFTRAKGGSGGDPANRFLDHGNYLAYGLGATATWVLGLPHGLAVLHGKTRRGGLVFDVADLIKDALILPQAFVSAMRGDSEQEFRERCVETLVQAEALDYMIDTLKAIATETGKHAA
jgi:CRISPR-associated protein Cas1